MPVRSLMELATSVCLKNIKEIQSVGDYLPFHKLRPILIKVESAYQLRQIEINSPHIEGETGELWIKLIERDFPLEYKRTAYKPNHPSKWYKVWEKYKRDHDEAIKESERKLKLSLEGLQENKDRNTSRIVDRKDKKYLPREPGTKRHWSQRQLPSNQTFGGGKRTSTSTGAGVMRKVRREVKELKIIHGTFSKTGRRPMPQAQVAAAPSAMVDDVRRAAQPSVIPQQAVPSAAVAEYEQRAVSLSDSDDDGDDGGEFFDRHQRPVKRPIASSKANATRATARPSAITSASSSKRGSGLLSNSYKPPAARDTFTRVISKPTPESKPKAAPADERPPATRPAQQQQRPKRQASPPPPSVPASSSRASPPPAAAAATATSERPPRKRKAVDVFMRPRKRP
jgi:elongin-A